MNYTRETTYAASPATVYTALTTESGLRGWWTLECRVAEGRAEFRFGDSLVVMAVEETLPDRRVAWRCVEHHFDGMDPTDEWVGTRVVFDLRETDEGGTDIAFTHEGLVPGMACWEACNAGWDRNLLDSLKRLVETGRGEPYQEWLQRQAAPGS